MIKRLLFLLLFLASPLLAQDTIQSTVCFADAQGNCLANGQLTLDLSQPARVTSGGGQVAPLRVSVTLDATGKIPAGTKAYGNDQLTPSGTTYLMRVYNSNGLLAANIGTIIIQGSSPVDLSQLTPVSVNPTVSTNAAVLGANNSFTGNNTASGDFYFGSGRPWIDVMAKGADPTGALDSLAAVNAACLAANGRPVYFPAGSYTISATPTSCVGANMIFLGAGRNVSKVTLAAGAYLVDDNQLWNSFQMRDMYVSGGAGVIRNRSTATGFRLNFEISNVQVDNFTGAAISHNSTDMAYWRIRNCQFRGANMTTTIGVALSGLTDESVIEGSSFGSLKVGVKLGSGGNNAHIRSSDFGQGGAGTNRVAVWVVPNTSSVNAGNGLVIDATKFGNENADPTDKKILYADEGAGTFFGDRLPATTASAGFITGHVVTNVLLNGSGNPGQPLVYTYTPNLMANRWGPIVSGGGQLSYILQCDASILPLADSQVSTRNNILGPVSIQNGGMVSAALDNVRATNCPGIGAVADPIGELWTLDTNASGSMGTTGQAGFTDLLSTRIGGYSLAGGATSANITDSAGGTDAVELTLPQNGQAGVATSTPAIGIPVWIEFDIKNGSSSPLASVDVNVFSGSFVLQRAAVPASGWRRVRMMLTPRTTLTTPSLAFTNLNYAGTFKIQIGRVYVYQAYAPVPGNQFEGSINVNGGATFTGAVTATQLNSTLYVLTPGADACSAINTQIAALPLIGNFRSGIVDITGLASASQPVPCGTTVNAGSPYLWIRGPGHGSLTFNCTVTAATGCFNMQEGVNFITAHGGHLSGFTILGQGSGNANAVGIHAGDMINGKFEDIDVDGFTGTNGACIWWDNVNGFFEDNSFVNVNTSVHGAGIQTGCTKDWRMTNTAATSGSSSFAHNWIINSHMVVSSGTTGISFESGSAPNSFWALTGNVGDTAPTTVLALSGLAFTAGPAAVLDGEFFISVECTSCATPGILKNIGASNSITLRAGEIKDSAAKLTDTGSGSFIVVGADPGSASTGSANVNSPQWLIRGRFAASNSIDQYSFQDVIGAGATPTTTLTLFHTGSSGVSNFDASNMGNSKFNNVLAAGSVTIGTTTFASLGTPVNGTLFYCSDCTIANPCAGAGTGALAKRLNGVWVCN